MTTTTTTRARELYAAHRAADKAAHRAACSFAYGGGTRKAWTAAHDKRDAIWEQLLALHDMTKEEWLHAPESQRKRLWGC